MVELPPITLRLRGRKVVGRVAFALLLIGAIAIGGVAGRIKGLGHSKPKGLLWWYYRLQAGYPHPNFGARLMGAAVNTLPCYEEQSGLIPSDWLNTTCVLYRTDLFSRERFPEFKGYSFMEDVHLSARIAKTHQLYFDAEAVYEHHSATTEFKQDQTAYAAAAIRNRRIVARNPRSRVTDQPVRRSLVLST